MLTLMYGLGPRGTCEDELNNGAIFLAWLAGTVIGGFLGYALFRLAHRRIGLREPGLLTKVIAGFLLILQIGVALTLLGFAAWVLSTERKNAGGAVFAASLSLPFVFSATLKGRQTALSAAIGAATIIFVLGLVPILTDTTCVD
jgi:hypothetical protein